MYVIKAFAGLDEQVRGIVLRGLLAAHLAVVEADLAPKQAAAAAGVAPSTVRAWCASGRLGRRVGGRWRVTAAEVRALIGGGRNG